MSEFAKIEKDAVNRLSLLTGEELRLYVYIKFHTWNDSGICRKSLHELSGLYNLNYDHTTARYKKLRAEGFCENTKKGIRVISDFQTSKSEVSKTSKTEVNDDGKLQNPKFQTSKTEVNDGEKLQNPKLHIRNTEPFKEQSFSEKTATETVATTSTNSNGHNSKFSLEECLRYVEARISRGEKIDTPHKFAKWLYQSGNDDVFIQATLYPDKGETVEGATAVGEISDKLREGLNLLYLVHSEGDEIDDYKKWYTPDEWAWLEEQLKNR